MLAAAPTTPPCFRHWRRSSSLHSGHLQRKEYFYICNSGKSAELVGAKPLHLLAQTALPLKSPTGAFIAAQTRIFQNCLLTGGVATANGISCNSPSCENAFGALRRARQTRNINNNSLKYDQSAAEVIPNRPAPKALYFTTLANSAARAAFTERTALASGLMAVRS